MTFLLTSDVHGDFERLERLIERYPDIDLHIDAGDLCLRKKTIHPTLVTVKGNNDFGSDEPLMRIIEVGNLKVMIAHGHIEHVKFGLERLKLKAKAQNVDLCVFGHTHRRHLDRDEKILFVNPGSLGGPEHSYAIYEDGQITFDRLIDGS